jgi:hypothetical protein
MTTDQAREVRNQVEGFDAEPDRWSTPILNA